MSATYVRTGAGSITLLPDGSVRIIRAMPGLGTFLSVDLTPTEASIIRDGGPPR